MHDLQILFREYVNTDLPAVAKLRSGSEDQVAHWQERISNYLAGIHNPQNALPQRVIAVAESDGVVVGFIAGQLTTRFSCQGELQWLDVSPKFRRRKIASQLIKVLAEWFIENGAFRICVDPGTEIARRFYAANGATQLNNHWMFWSDIRDIYRK